MTAKIAVSLPDELVDEARAAVERGEAASVSAYVAAALRAYGRRQSLEALLDELDVELGAPEPEVAAWAREALGRDRS